MSGVAQHTTREGSCNEWYSKMRIGCSSPFAGALQTVMLQQQLSEVAVKIGHNNAGCYRTNEVRMMDVPIHQSAWGSLQQVRGRGSASAHVSFDTRYVYLRACEHA